MVKRWVRNILYKFYKVGYFEYLRIQSEERERYLKSIASIGERVWISENALIMNGRGDREMISIGSNSRIMGNLFLFDFAGQIEIGSDCFVGPNTRIWSASRIRIGDRVLIAHDVNIHDNNSHPISAKERFEENQFFVENGKHKKYDLKPEEIEIGDDVWIGFNSTIFRGVKIGNGAIIGSNSVVTKDVEPWTVVVGNPLRIIRKLDPE